MLLFRKKYNDLAQNTRSSYPTDDSLLVVSHNVGQDLSSPASLNSLLLFARADIVLLQETTKAYIDKNLTSLSKIYPYHAIGTHEGEKSIGMCIFARHPITSVQEFKADEEGLVLQQRATIAFEEREIAIYNIHLTFPWFYIRLDPFFHFIPYPRYVAETRRRETDSLTKMFVSEKLAIVAAGDFNFRPNSVDYLRITSCLVDSFFESGVGKISSWPANRTPSLYIPLARPMVRIDYIFHSKSLYSDYTCLLPETGSDHVPVVSRLSFTGI